MSVCNVSSIIAYSTLCLGEDPPEDCYPSVQSQGIISLNIISQTMNIILGVSGNLLTLLSVPFARNRRQFGFKRSDDSTIPYVLNLAFTDLLFCLVAIPTYTTHYIFKGWPFGSIMCIATVQMRWSIIFLNHLSLALIAFSRFMLLKYPRFGKKIFSGQAAKVPLLSVWIIAILGVAMNLSGDINNYGYDCQAGYCSMFRFKASTKRLRLIHYTLGLLFPFFTIFCSNIGLWRIVRNSSTYLRDSSEHMRHQLSARDYRMAKTIGTVCMGYLICNMPITIYKHIRGKNANDSPYLKLVFSTLYFVQCSFNFIIYAARNKQYREAYFMFLRVAVFKLDDDPYLTTITSNRGTHRRRTTDRQSRPSGNSTSSGKPAKIRTHRVVFEKRHPTSSSNLSQKSEPCPGKARKKTKSIDDKNAWPLLSEIPSNPVTQ